VLVTYSSFIFFCFGGLSDVLHIGKPKCVVYHQCLTTPALVKLSYSIIYYCWSCHIMSYITIIYIISHYKTFISSWDPDSATKMTGICGSKSIYHAMKCCSYSHDIPITFPSYINHHQAIKDIYIYIIIYIYIYIIIYIYIYNSIYR